MELGINPFLKIPCRFYVVESDIIVKVYDQLAYVLGRYIFFEFFPKRNLFMRSIKIV